jgi:hypothetical protein
MTHMRDQVGYFYYRKLPMGTNKISYMRWSQAWMLLALSTLLEYFGHAASGMGISTSRIASSSPGC